MDLITKINIYVNRMKRKRFWGIFSELFWISKIDLLSIKLDNWIPPKLPRMRRPYEFSLGDEMDVRAINSDPRLDAAREKEHNLQLIQAGNRVVVGRYKDEIVFYAWAVLNRKSMHNKFFHLTQKEFIAMRAFVRKEQRGLGLYTYGLVYMLSLMKDRGFETGYFDISSDNLASLSSTYKLGATNTGSYYYCIRLFFHDFSLPVGTLKGKFIRKADPSQRI